MLLVILLIYHKHGFVQLSEVIVPRVVKPAQFMPLAPLSKSGSTQGGTKLALTVLSCVQATNGWN